jgi:FAD synthase
MEVIHDIDKARIAHPCVQTIGGFDGLHLGHQYLLS